MSAPSYDVIARTDRGEGTALRAAPHVDLVRRESDGKCTVIFVDNGTASRGSMSFSPYGDRAITYLGGWTSQAHARRKYNAARAAYTTDPE